MLMVVSIVTDIVCCVVIDGRGLRGPLPLSTYRAAVCFDQARCTLEELSISLRGHGVHAERLYCLHVPPTLFATLNRSLGFVSHRNNTPNRM